MSKRTRTNYTSEFFGGVSIILEVDGTLFVSLSQHSLLQQLKQFDFNLKWAHVPIPPSALTIATITAAIDIGSGMCLFFILSIYIYIHTINATTD